MRISCIFGECDLYEIFDTMQLRFPIFSTDTRFFITRIKILKMNVLKIYQTIETAKIKHCQKVKPKFKLNILNHYITKPSIFLKFTDFCTHFFIRKKLNEHWMNKFLFFSLVKLTMTIKTNYSYKVIG